MAQKIATVMGGTGFLARYIVPQLAKAGYRVRVASRRPSNARYLLTQGEVGQIQAVYAPIQNAAAVARAVHGADLVINLVAVFYESGKDQSFDATMVRGAATLAEAAAKAGVRRFIHVSALGADANHSSDSTRCKALGEDATLRAFPTATIVRPGLLVGPEDTFFNRFSTLPAVPLIGGGKTRFQPVFVSDVADAIAAIVADDTTAGLAYDIVGPEIYSFRALMNLMQSVTGSRAPLVHLPWGVAELIALASSLAPMAPPITLDQIKRLRTDNIADDSLPGLAALGIEPTPIEAVLPSYLGRFRNGGQYAQV